MRPRTPGPTMSNEEESDSSVGDNGIPERQRCYQTSLRTTFVVVKHVNVVAIVGLELEDAVELVFVLVSPFRD
ncbi:hypothetical protein TSUD_323490 [Trifolium subterraneum]|uniref:Uncharacterized protein n=1 Tax=Trifolium subterraneum TaxID=3900 RepID=A0A2Z6N6L8_TRISU|nr:hypothetical protein TSUD_323490 [Trifolium subterraneum]